MTPIDGEHSVSATAGFGYASGTSAPPRPEFQGWEEEAENLARRASEKTAQALHELASRLGYISSQNQDSPAPKLPHSSYIDINTPYCDGALLLQKSKADVSNVITQQSIEQDYVCNYCYLEISDFRSCSLNYTKKDWALLASCHVQACKSAKDRRAAYRCFACLWCGHSEIQSSAATFQDHLDACQFMKVHQQRDQDSHKASKKQSSPVSRLQQNFSSRPSLPSDSPHISRSSHTREYQSTPPHDKRDAVHASNRNRATAVPVSADEALPIIPRKPFRTRTTGERGTGNENDLTSFPGGFSSTDSPAATIASTSQRPDNGPSYTSVLTHPDTGGWSTDRAGISQPPDNLSLNLPAPILAHPRTSRPANQTSISRHPDSSATRVPHPQRITHPSPVNQTSITQHSDDLPSPISPLTSYPTNQTSTSQHPDYPQRKAHSSPTNQTSTTQHSDNPPSSILAPISPHTSYSTNQTSMPQQSDSSATRVLHPQHTSPPNETSITQHPDKPILAPIYPSTTHPTNVLGISQYPDGLLSAASVPWSPHTRRPSTENGENISRYSDNLFSATSGPSPYTNGPRKNGASISQSSPPYTSLTSPTYQYHTDNLPPSTAVQSYSYTSGHSAHRASSNQRDDPTTIGTRGQLRKDPRRDSRRTVSLDDTEQSPTTMPGTMSGVGSFGIHQLQEMGVLRADAEKLLRKTGGNVNEAAALAFSTGDDSPPLGGTHPHPRYRRTPSNPVNNEPRRNRGWNPIKKIF